MRKMLVLCLSLILFSFNVNTGVNIDTTEKTKCVSQLKVSNDTRQENVWELFVKVLVQVESSGDSTAVGNKDDVGILQITPVYVQEVNRIIKYKHYTLADRYDVQKSLEMFYIYQQHYNPSFNILKAIKLHNPKASLAYRNKIINQIKNYQNECRTNKNEIQEFVSYNERKELYFKCLQGMFESNRAIHFNNKGFIINKNLYS